MVVRRTNSSPSELFHHGIKNQHWGVRNGPPYPLDRKVSARIKKGHNEKLRDKKREGTSHYASVLGDKYRFPSALTGEDRFDKKWQDNESHLLEVTAIDNGSKYVTATSVISDFVGNDFKNTDGKYDDFKLRDDIKHDIRKNGFNSNYGLLCLKKINVDENSDNLGSTYNNCSKCSDMVELIMRGLSPDSFSAGRSQYGMLSTATEYHWDGAIPYKEKSLENIERRIKSFGNHGSGTISVRRADGTGHSMHFSATNKGIEVQDGQIAKTYNSISEALSAEGHDFNQFCKITRLDCATPNLKHMEEDSVIRMDTKFTQNAGASPAVLHKPNNTVYGNQYNSFTEYNKK